MQNLHLITKILFDPEYFYPERFVQIKTGDYVTNAIIVSNDEEELTVVSVQTVARGDDNFVREPYTQTIYTEQVANGDIELIFPDEPKSTATEPNGQNESLVNEKALEKVFIAFRETSNLLCEQEHILAEKGKVKDQTDIDDRNENRISAFRQLVDNVKE